MQPTPVKSTRVIAVESIQLNSRVDSDGAVTSEGLNELIEEALSEWAEVGYTELVSVQYSTASDGDSNEFGITYSALLVVRKPADD